MCVSMIVNIKDLLMESDFSMCLAYLLSYQEPDDPDSIITTAVEIKKTLLGDNFGFEELKKEELEDMFDFEIDEKEEKLGQRRSALKER